MVHYKLTYFPGRGAAETARQLFTLAKVDYDDVRITKEEWPKHKSNAPFGQVPILEEDGKKLPQSAAINRYLAKKFGYAGKNAWDEAQVDAYADQLKDFTADIRPYVAVVLGFLTGDAQKLKEEVFLPNVKKHLPFFVEALKKNGSGYLVGSSVTYVDLSLAELINTLAEKEPGLLNDYPELVAHKEKVHNIPEIKKWRESRPVTAF